MSADTTMWSSEAWSSAADLYLLGRAREGSPEAFGELWRRHLPAAYAVAHRYRGRAAPEDIVAEAATRVFALIRDGRGPDEHFRAYFLSTVRTVAVDMARRDLKVVPTDDADLESLVEPAADVAAADELAAGLGGDDGVDLVREAFRGLPERDQRVLWHTTVEGAAPRVVAPTLGMTPNAVSVRAMRARETLRARYLDARAQRGLPHADSDECRWTIEHLGAHIRGRLPKRQTERVESHLESCPHAAAIAADLRAVHDEFPSLVVPLLLAVGVTTPGFITGGALAGLTTAGGSAAAGTGAAGSGAAASGVTGGGGAAAAKTAGATADRLGQVASRVTTLAAGIAIGVGLASVAGTATSPTSSVSAQGSTGGSAVSGSALAGAGGPPAPAPPVTTGQVPSGTASPSANAAEAASARTPSPPPTSPSPTAQPPSRHTPAAPAPSPTASPTTAAAGGPAPSLDARLVSSGRVSRFSLRVRSVVPGDLTVRVSNAGGSGSLVAGNASWTCSATSTSSVTCQGQSGQVLLEQSGLGGISPVVVRVTDASGATFTRVVTPS